MNYQFYCYTKCSTCQKAKKWLDENNINYEEIDIKNNPPSKDWFLKEISSDIKKFFNTSGLLYKSLNIKEKIHDMTTEEVAEILSLNGMLVKRPLLIGNGIILKGFKEDVWKKEVK